MESQDKPDGESGLNISFKKPKRKGNQRQRIKELYEDPDEDDEKDLKDKLELCTELRKLRQKPNGVNVVNLTVGKKTAEEPLIGAKDPFKAATGGMVDMNTINSSNFQQNDDAYETGIGITQFSAETNTRDEDAEMLKYIDEKLKERKRCAAGVDNEDQSASKKFLSPEEAALIAVPEHLRQSSSKKSEEMLSNQMLSGIPEVDLGIEVKIKNIEATEEAKQKIIRDRMSKKEGPSQFVPSNMAVNFVQHNRFNIETPHAPKKQAPPKIVEKPKKVVVVGADPEEISGTSKEKESGEKATDDFHFEKFKKQFKRY